MHYKRAPFGNRFGCLLKPSRKEHPFMTSSTKFIGRDVHQESTSIAVRNSVGKILRECVIATKASTILEFINGLGGDVRVRFEEGTWAAWL